MPIQFSAGFNLLLCCYLPIMEGSQFATGLEIV